MKKALCIFLIIFILATLTGCAALQGNTGNKPGESPAHGANGMGEKISVADSRGKEILLEKPPKRIVSLTPSNTEILYALGMGDALIAVSEYCNFPEDAKNKQRLPTGERLNAETLIALAPDVVFLGRMAVLDDIVKQLEDAGLKIIITEANNLSETYETIRLIGTSTGRENQAQNIIDDMKKGFEQIRKDVRGKEPKSVYVEVSPLEYGLWSCGKNTFVQEIIDLIGAENIFEDIEGWGAVSEEQVISRNPDIILATASPLTGIDDPVGEILSRANWSNIRAIKNNKVLMLDGDMATRPGPRLLNAAEELMKAVYED